MFTANIQAKYATFDENKPRYFSSLFILSTPISGKHCSVVSQDVRECPTLRENMFVMHNLYAIKTIETVMMRRRRRMVYNIHGGGD